MRYKIEGVFLVLIVCLISGCGPKVGNENGKGESDNNSKIEMSDNTKSTDFNISYGIEEVKQNDFRLEYNGEPVSLHSFVNCSTDIKTGIEISCIPIKCTLCQGHYDFSFSDFYFIFVCCVEASK